MDRFGEFRVATDAVAVASDFHDVALVERALATARQYMKQVLS